MKKRFLVFSDLHIEPQWDAMILLEIGEVALKLKPDYIVCTGDIGEFASQNRFVKDRGAYSLPQELTAVTGYIYNCLIRPIKEYNMKRKRFKKKLYKPHIVFCMGNHDAPVQDSLIPLLNEQGILCIPYKSVITLEGICFSHAFEAGISGSPCTSTEQILKFAMGRTVSGHSHVRSITEQRDATGYKNFAIKMPCATTKFPEWAGQGCYKWDRGYMGLTVDTESDWFQYTFKEVAKNG